MYAWKNISDFSKSRFVGGPAAKSCGALRGVLGTSTPASSSQWCEKMARKPAGHRNRNRITHRPVAVVVRTWKLIDVGCSHEPSTFSDSHESGAYFPLID